MKRLHTPTTREGERGQALVLIALAFIGLAAFIGLTIDSGILFSNVGHLRRAVDAASLAAANQFREGRTPAELSGMAQEFLELNGLTPTSTVAFVCDLATPGSVYDDPSLCPGGTNPPSGSDTPRKYVRVEADLPVYFAFLPIIGWGSTTIHADSISEAASVDLVLVVDVSPSMSYDLCTDGLDNENDGVGDGTVDDCYFTGTGTGGDGIPESDVAMCTAATTAENKCHPFEEVRAAAKALVNRMYFPYDRISIVTFAKKPVIQLELDDNDAPTPCGINPDPRTCALSVLDSLDVELEADTAVDCPGWEPDPSGCMPTNTGDGLRQAGGRFCLDDGPPAAAAGNGACDRTEMREEAVWIVLLISDGAANAGLISEGPDIWYCPSSTWASPAGSGPPFCRDASASSRHPAGDPDYDADDYARDMADFVGCPGPSLPQPAACSTTAPGGQGAVIFTIGLGDRMITEPDGDADAGEQLMRYIAAVGDDGDPATDPCSSYGPGAVPTCGNYYFAPDSSGLVKVFEAIASRIFTRITH